MAAGSAAQQVAGAKFGPNVYECLTKLGLTKFQQIIDAAGMKPFFSTTYQSNTLFAATNAAVDRFYAALQMTEAEALADRALMKKVLQYNTAPYVRRTSYWPTYQNGFKKQKTLIPAMMLKLWSTRTERKAVQGFAQTAALIGKPNTYDLTCAKSVVHVTNTVLVPIVMGS
ncbi:hypothetical protein CHLNCDRAFT_144157 [Chlorella variabilis]|uniref:FAS1 domain-containing protein n=1 Tax=Chlorella variabilis TaxID=554065 RepID=E1ZC16_CHLVA|nr:hypothetical protein CHLNCDRAFT_144157 [Chlorella variabilis]EFN56734.1 hypothetical protein CHLNCDRAFT_144157 [Chlorella variabilis]|eukprot:XP_005848836.1 hypothetical protein CHLNCDRAFT_144157 [Chlorella variabilis]